MDFQVHRASEECVRCLGNGKGVPEGNGQSKAGWLQDGGCPLPPLGGRFYWALPSFSDAHAKEGTGKKRGCLQREVPQRGPFISHDPHVLLEVHSNAPCLRLWAIIPAANVCPSPRALPLLKSGLSF